MRVNSGKKRKAFRRWGCMFLAAVLTAAALLTDMPVMARAAGASRDIANVVVFVRFDKDKNRDVFNAMYADNSNLKRSNWQNIKNMYIYGDGFNYGTQAPKYNNSFTEYIRQITEDKVHVQNYFPQEITVTPPKGWEKFTTGTAVYDLPASCNSAGSLGATDSGSIVRAVVEAIKSGKISLPRDKKLDNREPGVIDNLTIIVQGDANGMSAHKTNYAGTDTINVTGRSLRVSCYNLIPSDLLVSSSGSTGTLQAQGVVAHEFLHTLGLPDLYRRSDSGVPVGRWDVMAANSAFLQYPLSYLRAEQGWIDKNQFTIGASQGAGSRTFTLKAVSADVGKTADKVLVIQTPLSDSEYIVMEYRKKPSSSNPENVYLFERQIPHTGLLLYRVNKNKEYLVNSDWTTSRKNYIYVYRPDAENPEEAKSVNVNMASLSVNGSNYGSLDLGAGDINTLHYSDGANSGLRVSNVQMKGDEITFTLSWPNYNSDMWNKLGDSNVSEDEALFAPAVCVHNNVVYAAYLNAAHSVVVKRFNGSVWENVITVPNAGIINPLLKSYGNSLYLGYFKDFNLNTLICGRIENGKLNNEQKIPVSGASSITFVEGKESKAIAVAAEDSLKIWNVENGTLITEGNRAKSYTTPAVAEVGGKYYVLYSDYFESNRQFLEMYSAGKWYPLSGYTLTAGPTNTHVLRVYDGKIYAFAAGPNASNSVFSVFSGTSCIQNITLTQVNANLSPAMDILGGTAYIAYIDTEQKVHLLRQSGNGFLNNAGDGIVARDTSDISMAADGNTIYLACKGTTGTPSVRSWTVAAADKPTAPPQASEEEDNLPPPQIPDGPTTPTPTTPTPTTPTPTTPTPTTPTPSTPTPSTPTPTTPTPTTPTPTTPTPTTPTPTTPTPTTPTPTTPTPDTSVAPAGEQYQVVLNRPAGYDAGPDDYEYNPVYIDGVAYQPTVQGTQCRVQLPSGYTTAKVATMYYYQTSSAGDRMLPRGMCVWKLSCSNGVYSATELTEYRDLLSYYGFSIRLSAPPGMRVCSGIRKTEREKLIAENRLMEYGTLAISASAMKNCPLVKSGEKVQQGRSYWKDGAGVHDKCYRTDSDKVYFTNVLQGFPDNKEAYTLEIYFRPYVIVVHEGEELIIYGAPVNRKICQVAKQMYDRGDRSAYVTKIVNVSGE